MVQASRHSLAPRLVDWTSCRSCAQGEGTSCHSRHCHDPNALCRWEHTIVTKA